YAKVPYMHLPLALGVLSEIILHPLLREEDFGKEKRVILEELHSTMDSPEDLVSVLSQRLTWGDHPLGREIIGTEQSIEQMRLDDVAAHLLRYYGPNRCVLSVAGRIDTAKVLRLAEERLGEWAPVAEQAPLPAQPSLPGPRLLVRYKETEQAQVVLTLPGLARGHPHQYTLGMLHTVLGAGMSSRLFQEIRENRALAYSVSASGTSYQDAGSVSLYAGVSPLQAIAAVDALLTEWVRLRDEPVLAEEVLRAREMVRGSRLMGFEDSGSVAGWFGQQELLSQKVRTLDEVLEIIDGIDASSIHEVAQQLICLLQMTLTVVGPFPDDAPFSDCLAAWSGATPILGYV
ncbi:MAG: insulinase family protein, partial [Chloroflexi bacterium]|nr:insulinase family protein [Chloroflexota bacterium]